MTCAPTATRGAMAIDRVTLGKACLACCARSLSVTVLPLLAFYMACTETPTGTLPSNSFGWITLPIRRTNHTCMTRSAAP